MGTGGAVGPLNSPIRRAIRPKFDMHVSIVTGMLVPNFIAIDQSWLVHSHITQKFRGPLLPPWGGGGAFGVGVAVVQA